MSGKAMSLKAKIRNLANEKDISAQVVLQNYMFERFIERLSKSDYKDNFILKGGILIASIVGIDKRSTMDMDATIKNYPLDIASLSKAVKDICDIAVQDNVKFEYIGIEPIRKDDAYGGFRVSLQGAYDTILTPLQIDMTTGDEITPKEILYIYKKIINNETIDVWAYNIETVLAEKVESILNRGELNTRPRDFYDVYILSKTQEFDTMLFIKALRNTAEHRKTTHIFENIKNRIKKIENSKSLELLWIKYTRNYRYAKDIAYSNVIESLKLLIFQEDM
ncbi:MAG: Abortive phage infection protein [Fusobacteria bacterium]|nr:MAG: Abortive phage infection protein [Fusobacteriota bacterium]KAF0229190.1 MAG: Abortive phage infection [Fusobacteriota bacterium]